MGWTEVGTVGFCLLVVGFSEDLWWWWWLVVVEVMRIGVSPDVLERARCVDTPC